MNLEKRGSIPIPYIIALIFAVVVIVLVGYWFFTTGGEFSNIASEKLCEGKKESYCQQYKLAGSPPKRYFSQASCAATDAYAPECCRFSWAQGGAEICS